MKKISGIIALVSILLVVLVMLLNQQSDLVVENDWYMPVGHMTQFVTGEYWLLGIVGWLAGWAAVIFGTIWLIKQFFLKEPINEALQILNNRLAAGELSIDEYMKLKKELRK